MKASLDTNVIIHFYRADLQEILFDFFDEGVSIYDQIRDIELVHHGQDVLDEVNSDIGAGKIQVYTNQMLKDLQVHRIFEHNVNENRNLYGAGDLGEVYAISLAQTLGTFSLVTDDTKQGGPYMSLLQFEDDVMPFTFADVLILRYLLGKAVTSAHAHAVFYFIQYHIFYILSISLHIVFYGWQSGHTKVFSHHYLSTGKIPTSMNL